MSVWTEDLIAHARRVAETGASASEIARAISTPDRLITRNAVIGACNRGHLKLKGSPTYGARGNKNNVNVIAIQRKAKRGDLPEPVLRAPKEEPAPLGRPGEYRDGCKWLHGESLSREWVQCGHDRADGSPYCAHHHARARTAARTFRRENPHSHSASRETERALLKVMR